MTWQKLPVQLPFLAGLNVIINDVSKAATAIQQLLTATVAGLKVVEVLYLAKVDAFALVFKEIVVELENLINDTFNTGFYTLVVLPTDSAPQKAQVQTLSLTLPSSFPTVSTTAILTSGQVATLNSILAKAAVQIDPSGKYIIGGGGKSFQDSYNEGLITADNINNLKALLQSPNGSLTPDQVETINNILDQAGYDPVLTYDQMKLNVAYAKLFTQVVHDPFGLPLMTPGQCVQKMISKLNDTSDPKRPVFSTDSAVTAFGIVVSAPDVAAFVALAQPLLNLLNFAPLQAIVNEALARSGQPATPPGPGAAPQWLSTWNLASIGTLKNQRDALITGLNQALGALQAADQVISSLLKAIELRISALDAMVTQFEALIKQLQAALNAEGIYIYRFTGAGGTTAIATDLKQYSTATKSYYFNGSPGTPEFRRLNHKLNTFQTKTDTLFSDTTGYTAGFLFVGGGPTYAPVALLGDLLCNLRTKAVGGMNEKQLIAFVSATGRNINKEKSKITIHNIEVSFNQDAASLRQDIQVAVNSSHATEAIAAIITDQTGDFVTGFTVEYQGADGRKSQPLLNFGDPGASTVQLATPTGPGIFTIAGSAPLSSASSATDVETALNNVPGLYNSVTVIGNYVDGFQISIQNKNVSLLSSTGPVTVSIITTGRDPANSLQDTAGQPMTITVTELQAGALNDPCGS